MCSDNRINRITGFKVNNSNFFGKAVHLGDLYTHFIFKQPPEPADVPLHAGLGETVTRIHLSPQTEAGPLTNIIVVCRAVTMQRPRDKLGKHVPAATHTHATMELFLETVSFIRSVQKGYKEDNWKKNFSSWKGADVQRGLD
jgi:hypothetical protein